VPHKTLKKQGLSIKIQGRKNYSKKAIALVASKSIMVVDMPNQYQNQLEDILQRKLSREEFLKFSGVAVLGLVGFTGFLKNLHKAIPGRTTFKPVSNGYGRSFYSR
jgi:preprotein translocase subunit Sss1